MVVVIVKIHHLFIQKELPVNDYSNNNQVGSYNNLLDVPITFL